jgi:putative addiction module component (TIGR02574 family)
MTKAAVSKSMRRLPLLDRMALLYELWLSILPDLADQRNVPLTKAQKRMVDKRLREIEEHPERGMPLKEFRKKLHQASRKKRAGNRRKNAA